MNGLQRKIIIKALDADDRLSEWESEFISHLADQSDDYELSEKQNHVLNRIWEKVDV